MIVTDIDGTLVDHQQRISDRNKDRIRCFQQEGGLFTLATGRMEDAALSYAQELDIQLPVILYNGGKIVDLVTGQCFFEALLSAEAVKQSLQLLHEYSLDIIVYSERKLWVDDVTPVIMDYMNKDRVTCHRWENPNVLLKAPVNKIMIIKENQDFDGVLRALSPLAGKHCELVMSEPTYLEILPRGVSKGSALKMLTNLVQIDIREVIAIGDNLNDLEMIGEAGLGVAVDNAHVRLKEKADYLGKSHLDHAVAEIIEKFCLLNK
ncbi:HAD family hydrolase [Paenibacillus sp. RC67]|uniref:HAD family hydrolase n=1 Tax=Paenibacillus sp. RC67 TaxID=3039392 RepID=UPI0024AD7B11|nr:HAD family hydrolase [Paenibacillus sp. RC67]